MLYGCRREDQVSGFLPFQLLSVVPLRVSFEHLLPYEADRPASERRIAAALALAQHCTTPVDNISFVSYQGSTLRKFKVRDSVSVARGSTLRSVFKRPPFSSKFYGLCLIFKAKHSRYKLKTSHDRYS